MISIHFASDLETRCRVFVVHERHRGNSFVQFREEFMMSALKFVQDKSAHFDWQRRNGIPAGF